MRIDKISYEVIVLTDQFKIEGEVHLIEGERITDFIRTEESTFLPITDATISTLNGGAVLYKTEFLSLNRDKVTLVMPRHNMID